MNLKRMLCSSSIATAIGLAGLFGVGIATANAAPASGSTTQSGATGSQPAPKVNLTHHQRKEIAKQAEKQAKGPQTVTPASTSH